MNKMDFTLPVWFILISLITGAALTSAFMCDFPPILLLPILIFLFYDIGFYYSESSLSGRSIQGTTDSIRAACTYMSYFIAIIGLALTIGSELEGILSELKTNEYLFKWLSGYFVVAAVFSAMAMLFIPVQYSYTRYGKVTDALKACFCAVMFLEKTTIVIFIYIILQIVKTMISVDQ